MQCYAPVVLIHANARALGSYQADALQNITGTIVSRKFSDTAHGMISNATGAFAYGLSAGKPGSSAVAGAPSTTRQDISTFDASLVARTSTETRGMNTALAPRMIAF